MKNMFDFVENRRKETYDKYVCGRKVIYLDTNYWNNITKQDTEKRILIFNLSKKLVEQNKCVFPISEINYIEIRKKHDINSIKRTIQIIDILSNGISFISDKERNMIEILFLLLNREKSETKNIKELIWTNSSFLFGVDFFYNQQEKLMKDFYEYMSELSLYDTLFSSGYSIDKPFSFKDNVALLNENKEKYAHENVKY